MHLSHAKYELLIEAFRQKPGNVLHASKYAGVNRASAKRAWEVGYQARGKYPGRISISEMLQQEAEEAAIAVRTAVHKEMLETETKKRIAQEADRIASQRLSESARAERSAAAGDALSQKVAEQKAANALLASTSNSLAQLHKATPAIGKLMTRVNTLLEKEIANDELKLNEVWGVFDRYVKTQEKIANMLSTSVNLARKVTGEPDTTVQVVNGPASQLSTTDAEELLGGDPKRVLDAITSLVMRNPNDDAKILLERQRYKISAAAREAQDETRH